MFLLWEENSAICQRYSGYIFQVFLAQSLFAAHLRGKDNNSDLSCPFFGFSFSFSLQLCRGFGTSSFYFIFPLARGKIRQHVPILPMSHEKTTYKNTCHLSITLASEIYKASKVSLLKRRIEKSKSDIGKTRAHIKISIFKEIVNCFDLLKWYPQLHFKEVDQQRRRRRFFGEIFGNGCFFWGVCEIELHI